MASSNLMNSLNDNLITPGIWLKQIEVASTAPSVSLRGATCAASKRSHHASLPCPLPFSTLYPALHRRGGRCCAATRGSCVRRRGGAAEPRRAQAPSSRGTSSRGTQAPPLSRHQASRCAQAPRSRWARPGAACQWASPAQLRVNLAPQLALPAAAGMLAPRLGSAAGPRTGAWHGAYR